MENDIIEEFCPFCDHLNKIHWDGKQRKGKCERCGADLLYCSVCDMETGCKKCPYL